MRLGPTHLQQQGRKTSNDGSGAGKGHGGTAGERRWYWVGSSDGAVASAGTVRASAAVSGRQGEVGAGKTGGVAGVDHDGSVAEKASGALVGRKIQVEESAKSISQCVSKAVRGEMR